MTFANDRDIFSQARKQEKGQIDKTNIIYAQGHFCFRLKTLLLTGYFIIFIAR